MSKPVTELEVAEAFLLCLGGRLELSKLLRSVRSQRLKRRDKNNARKQRPTLI